MPKDPSGNRPVPSVASGRKPSFNKTKTNAIGGSRHTKTPTGNRTTPNVAKDKPRMPSASSKNATKPAVKSMKHPHPNTARTSGKGRKYGG